MIVKLYIFLPTFYAISQHNPRTFLIERLSIICHHQWYLLSISHSHHNSTLINHDILYLLFTLYILWLVKVFELLMEDMVSFLCAHIEIEDSLRCVRCG